MAPPVGRVRAACDVARPRGVDPVPAAVASSAGCYGVVRLSDSGPLPLVAGSSTHTNIKRIHSNITYRCTDIVNRHTEVI